MIIRLLLLFSFVSTFAGTTFGQPGTEAEKTKKKQYALIEEAKRTNNKHQLIFAYTNLGKILTEEGNYGQALGFLMKAKSYNKEDSAYITPYYTAFSVLFSKIGAYSGAIEYEKKIFNQPVSGSKLSQYYSASNIGLLYLKLNMIDSASSYYSRQYEISLGMDDYIAVSSALNNQGLALFDKKEYSAALRLFQKAMEIWNENKGKPSPNFQNEIEEFRFNVLENIGQCYFFLGLYPKAVNCLERAIVRVHQTRIDHNKEILVKSYLALSNIKGAEALIHDLDTKGDLSTIEARTKLEEIRLNFFLFTNNLVEVKKCVAKLELLRSELETEKIIKGNQMSLMISRYLINEAKSNIQREKSMKNIALKRLSVEQQQNASFILALIVAGILFSLSLVLYAQFSKIKKRKFSLETERLMLNNERQDLKIRTQEMYLTEYALDFTKNREHESTIIKHLNTIVSHKAEMIPGEIKSLIAELKQKQNIDKRAENLAIDAQNLLADFRYVLQERHPDLKKSDIQLCYLLRLELSNKEIAAIKNVSPDSIKIFKNRLKNKLLLPAETSLTDYLNSI